MGYISSYNTKFVNFMTRKYKKYLIRFEFIDDYLLWLYYYYCGKSRKKYYEQLEKDIIEYSNFQTGIEREKRDKLNGKWENG